MNRTVLTSRKAWHAERSTGIGASEAAAILGVSPWHSPLSLFYLKRGEAPPNQGEEFARRLGLELEDAIAKLWSGETRRKYRRPEPGTFWLDRHATKPFMVASIDGECADAPDVDELDDVLEIKTAAISKASHWIDEPPIDYIVQVQHQLAVTGKNRAALVGLIGGVSLRYADIQRDPEFIEMLEEACAEFWRRVELNDPPPADGSDATRSLLGRLYPTARPTSATLPPESLEWDQDRQRAADEIKKWEGVKAEAENKLKAAIADNAQGILPNGVVYTLKEQTRAAHIVKESKFRALRRVAPKGEKMARSAAALKDRDLKADFAAQESGDEPWA